MNTKTIAGIGIAAIAMLGFTTPAHAASHDWQAVANCESGGDWHINTGNGYYGGLQFSESTWLANGGATYGSNASVASESGQIAIAERVLETQGIGAWPVCGVHLYDDNRSNLESEDQAAPAVQYKLAKSATHESETAVNKGYPVPKCNTWDLHVYEVKSGDTLSSIARSELIHHWQEIYNDSSNKGLIKNPNLIYPGQWFCIPKPDMHIG